MSRLGALFSSAREAWGTPDALYRALDKEFGFTFDPCPLSDPREAGLPLFGTDGLHKSWRPTACSATRPTVAASIGGSRRLARGTWPSSSCRPGPTRGGGTSTRWAPTIRFLRGRLTFKGAPAPAPFPSVVLVYRRRFAVDP